MRLLHFFCVNNVRLGRTLGIGTRLAAKILREQAQKLSASEGPHTSAPAIAARPKPKRNPATAKPRPAPARSAVPKDVARRAARGGRGFGKGFWGAFAHAGRALWYEITGVFFAIFALFFIQGVWRLRADWQFGPDHRHFYIYLVLAIAFVYFSISAFVRAHRMPRSR